MVILDLLLDSCVDVGHVISPLRVHPCLIPSCPVLGVGDEAKGQATFDIL